MSHNLYWKQKLKMIHFKKNNLRSVALFFLCLHAYPIKSHNNNFVIHNTKIIFSTIAQYLRQIKHHIVDQYITQYNKQSAQSAKEISCTKEKISTFLYALKSDRLKQLMLLLQSPNLAVAEKAFCALKKYWPYHREYTFLIPDFHNNKEEFPFAENFGRLIKKNEMFHITRNDYIAKYTNKKSFKRIQEYTKRCVELQKEGDLASLWSEIINLRNRVIKNGRKTVLADNICLAIVETVYRTTVTKLLHKVKYAPTLEEAEDARQAITIYILRQEKDKNNEQIEYKCPCCGSQDLDLALGRFDICSECYWEDGNILWQNPDYIRNANDLSSNETRQD